MTDADHVLTGFCSVERAFTIIGGAATFMVLRKILLFKVRRFDEFCSNLGIARASLDRILSRLCPPWRLGAASNQRGPPPHALFTHRHG
jgi:DNA-binding HxlR family transcriptional regulator